MTCMIDNPKQTIQWFPGHMEKAKRNIIKSLKLVDAVAEIRDARLPESSKNPDLDSIIGDKPRIILLNKSDYADAYATEKWIEYYRLNGITAIAVDCRTGKGVNAFIPTVKRVLEPVMRRNEQRGMPGKALRIMVVGIPNIGKSSFINRMAKKNKAIVANKPGVTKANQWFNIGNGVELLDTPGVLWPKFDDASVGDKLAFSGAVKAEIMDPEIMACRLIGFMKESYHDRLESRYKLSDISGMEDYEILEQIGRKRGMLISGGEIDTLRAAKMLMTEFKDGVLGKITYEMPG